MIFQKKFWIIHVQKNQGTSLKITNSLCKIFKNNNTTKQSHSTFGAQLRFRGRPGNNNGVVVSRIYLFCGMAGFEPPPRGTTKYDYGVTLSRWSKRATKTDYYLLYLPTGYLQEPFFDTTPPRATTNHTLGVPRLFLQSLRYAVHFAAGKYLLLSRYLGVSLSLTYCKTSFNIRRWYTIPFKEEILRYYGYFIRDLHRQFLYFYNMIEEIISGHFVLIIPMWRLFMSQKGGFKTKYWTI